MMRIEGEKSIYAEINVYLNICIYSCMYVLPVNILI